MELCRENMEPLRHLRCDDPQAPELYTDPDSLAWAMKKQVRLVLLRPLFWLVWLAVLFWGGLVPAAARAGGGGQ